MQMLTRIPLFVQPSVRPGLNALAAFLVIENYSQHCREQIIDYVAREGTIGGLVDRGWLERADEELAEQVYCDAMPMTPGVSSAWDGLGFWTDVESYEDALARALADTQDDLPALSGGAPEDWPRKHTPEDRAAFEFEVQAWFRHHRGE